MHRIIVRNLETGEQRVVVEGGVDARYVPTGHLVYASGRDLHAVPFDLDRLEVTGGPVPVAENVRIVSFTAAQFSFSNDGTMVYLSDMARKNRLGGAQGRDRSCRRALAGPLRLSRPALDSGVSRARVVGSGGSRCRVPVCLIRQAIAMVRPENRQVMVSNRRLMAGIRTSCALRRVPLSSRESPYC